MVEEELEVIVIDNGSGTIKAGYSGEDAPRSVFPSLHGTVENPELYRGRAADVKESYVGSQAQEHREMLSLVRPIQRGLVNTSEDWDRMEKIWEYTFTQELHVNPESLSLPVLLTDAPLNPKANREKMAQIMFENFKVPGFYIATQAVLSLFASGRTRGVVVETGAGVTHSVPVFEGYALPHAILRLEVAGTDLTECLRRSLAQRGHSFSNAQLDIVRDIKEKLCYVNPAGECRSLCPEVLFNPSLLGPDHPAADQAGMCDMAYSSISKCDADLQQDLLAGVVVAGGTSMLPGFTDRVGQEMSRLAQGSNRQARVRVIPDSQHGASGYNSQRKHAAWIGGSMFASLPTFGQILISKQEWDDSHDSIVHRKCF